MVLINGIVSFGVRSYLSRVIEKELVTEDPPSFTKIGGFRVCPLLKFVRPRFLVNGLLLMS